MCGWDWLLNEIVADAGCELKSDDPHSSDYPEPHLDGYPGPQVVLTHARAPVGSLAVPFDFRGWVTTLHILPTDGLEALPPLGTTRHAAPGTTRLRAKAPAGSP